MNFLPLIEAKRDGRALTPGQIQQAIAAFTAGQIPDYQMSAFLMAVYFRGLDTSETQVLTLAMRDSGEVLAFPADSRPLVDKHSTGGVGDKVSLPLAPLLACLGFRVPMVSGRGLGITGGTLDKLESIPGFRTSLSRERIIETVQRVGCVICGQTERMVPANKRLYALRDVTGTVPSLPLIVASILSKKLAEGISALVLDVKFGAAAFMSTMDQARELAGAMVSLGSQSGVNTRALLTNMDAPLGRSAGNWLEVKEAVACLNWRPGGLPMSPIRNESRGRSEDAIPLTPALSLRERENVPQSANMAKAVSRSNTAEDPAQDLSELVVACAALLLVQSGKAKDLARAREEAEACLASGAPRKKWDEMLAAQGADLDAFNRMLERDCNAPAVTELRAARAGSSLGATQTGSEKSFGTWALGGLQRNL